jgi:hypothetical protein
MENLCDANEEGGRTLRETPGAVISRFTRALFQSNKIQSHELLLNLRHFRSLFNAIARSVTQDLLLIYVALTRLRHQ